jgi:shikimate kinase
LPFVDSDQVIEANAGMPIPWIMAEHGETVLRDQETVALKQIMKTQESVIALGGGALLREKNRVLVESSGSMIVLMAELSTLLERLQNDSHTRPLLAGDLESKLTFYLENRAEHYASFPLKVLVDGKTIKQIVHQIQVMLGRHHLSAMGEYDVIVGQVSNLTNFHMQNPILVTDENVAKLHLEKLESILHAAGCELKSVILPTGEIVPRQWT